MACGGSINLNGSNYLRKIREIDKVVKFLEELKNELNSKDTETINKVIKIIIDYGNNLSEDR